VSTAAMEVIVAHNRVPHCSGLFLTAVNRRCPFRTRCYVQLSELSYCRHHAKFCDSPQDGSRWRAWCGEPGVSAAASSPRMARPPAVMLAVPTWEASPLADAPGMPYIYLQWGASSVTGGASKPGAPAS
jgi:hypothetical protein